MTVTANKAIKPSTQKLTLLESFRGIAALLIVAFHATELFSLKFNQPFLKSFFQFGDSGVDFFFVLSGFFLAFSSFKYIGYQHTAKGFLLKRCIRLYPFYWLINICVIPIYFLVPSFGKGYENDLDTILKSLLLIPQDHAPILSVAWFLSHLIFFYLVFTAVILRPKITSKIILIGLLGSVIFNLADAISGFQLRSNTFFAIRFIFSYYNLEFTAGCLLGTIFQKAQLKKSVGLSILLMGSFIFISSGVLDVYVFQLGTEHSGFSDCYEFIAYGMSSVLIVGGASLLEKNRKIQANRWLVRVGAASFAIYLTHYPILSIFTKIIQLTGIRGLIFQTFCMVLACMVTVLMGCLAHLHVEKRLVSIFKHHLVYKRA